MKFKSNLNGKVTKRRGFTLIEVVVALAILVIIIASTMSLLTSSYTSLRNTEMKGIAKNIATYAVEYIRARNVTEDNLLGHASSDLGNDASHYFPGLEDLWDIPLTSIGHPYGSTAGIGFADHCINVNPALPNQTFNDSPDSFYYSLQGYDSLGDFDNLTAADPSPEDANLFICAYSTHHYHVRDVYSYNGGIHTYNHILWKFPLISTNPDAIKSFTGGTNYLPMIYTPDTDKTNKNNPEYSPFYTNDTALKKRTQNYRGFRVLTTVVARKRSSSDPDHVQYYDVKVVVFWMVGNYEHSYTLQTQIVTYGGS